MSVSKVWRSIESAPKDGTLIIGALIHKEKIWRIFDMQWSSWGVGGAWFSKSGHSIPNPTHWMRIPEVLD